MLHKYKRELPLLLHNPTSSGLLTETKRISAKLVLLKVLVKSSTSVDFPLEWPAALQNLDRRA